MSLTELELKALKAIDASEYGDYLGDPIWAFSIAQRIDGVAKASVPGIISSLVKKGLAKSEGAGDEATVRILPAGVAAYVAAIAPAAPKKPLR